MDDTEDKTGNYYIRIRGRVLGPYSIKQLKTLRGRGQFGRANEVSLDGTTWHSAATIEHLLDGDASKKARAEAEKSKQDDNPSTPGPPSRKMEPVWYYSVGEEQCGPVTLLELRGMIAGNQLILDDLIWKAGMADWSPIRDVPEVNVVVKPNAVQAPQPGANTFVAQQFCYACGSPVDLRAELCPKCGVRQRPVESSGSRKNRMTAAILALLLGGIGIHHFYLGNTLLGVIYLLFCWTFIPGIIALVEGIFLLCMSDASFDKRYPSH
ncbi:MAG: GYF domain-containing protein [Schlesneria sp.]